MVHVHQLPAHPLPVLELPLDAEHPGEIPLQLVVTRVASHVYRPADGPALVDLRVGSQRAVGVALWRPAEMKIKKRERRRA